MCGPRPSDEGRGDRQDAGIMVRCKDQRLPGGRVLDQLQHAEHGYIIAATVIAAWCQAVGHVAVDRVGRHGRGMEDWRYAVPAARIRDTDEQRKQPHPKYRRGKEFPLAVKQARHDLFVCRHCTRTSTGEGRSMVFR